MSELQSQFLDFLQMTAAYAPFSLFKELLAFQKCHVILSFVIKRSLQECVERRKIFSAWKNVNDFIHFKLCCILYFNSFFIRFKSIFDLIWPERDMRTFFCLLHRIILLIFLSPAVHNFYGKSSGKVGYWDAIASSKWDFVCCVAVGPASPRGFSPLRSWLHDDLLFIFCVAKGAFLKSGFPSWWLRICFRSLSPLLLLGKKDGE